MNKIIYRATSGFDFVYSLLLRVGCIALIVYLASRYEENPPVIIIACIVCFFVFLNIGNDEITVFPDKLLQADTSIMGLIFKSNRVIYEIKDIQAASLPEETGPGLVGMGIIAILTAILPKARGRNARRLFYLDLKDGKTIAIHSNLGQNKVKNVVRAINSLV